MNLPHWLLLIIIRHSVLGAIAPLPSTITYTKHRVTFHSQHPTHAENPKINPTHALSRVLGIGEKRDACGILVAIALNRSAVIGH
ncbi:MAG: hypothetical protein ACYTX0_38030 [Nostoc sp.]